MARTAPTPVTTEMLKAAWLEQPKGPAWPATFEAAVQNPFFARLLKLRAIGLARAAERRAKAPFDARRAAANDLE